MEMKVTAILAAMLLAAAPAFAHPDHDAEAKPVANRSIAEKAQDAVLAQIAQSRLHASWGSAIPGRPQAQTAKGTTSWTVPFRKANGGETLIVTLDEAGGFISAKPAAR
jgi:hypothetical protein